MLTPTTSASSTSPSTLSPVSPTYPFQQSPVHQFIPVARTAALSLSERQELHLLPSVEVIDHDQDMDGAESVSDMNGNSTSSSRMSMDTSSSFDQDDSNGQEGNGGLNIQLNKRTKVRLDPAVAAPGIMASGSNIRSLPSGNHVQDIFQECFYNAASSSSR